MVARPSVRKSSCNAGELDPLLAGRPDIKQYYSGALRMKNFEPVPQSGFRLMPGTCDAGIVRPDLDVITGTDKIQPVDDIICDISFDAAPLACIEISNIRAAGAASVCAEIWRGAVWVAFGKPINCNTTAMTRWIAVAPGVTGSVNRIRLRRISGSAGFSVAAVTLLREGENIARPRYCSLNVAQDLAYLFSFGSGFCDVWKDKQWVALVRVPGIAAQHLADIDFYAEASTVGIFHEDIKSIRIRRAGSDYEWSVDDWPYEDIPEIDYGGDYKKTDDVWNITLTKGEGNWPWFSLDITIDKERTRSVIFNQDWNLFANNIANVINSLPSVKGGVIVQMGTIAKDYAIVIVTFGGASTGQEYQLSAMVGNTTFVSALSYHTQIGDTEGEPIFSDLRGWPGTVALMQDRVAYARIKEQTAAQLLSQTGEYFNLNIESTIDSAARLDRLRSQTSEKIYRVKESKYFLAFTNLGVYFATNRLISRNEPLNYIMASEIGICPNTTPADIEGLLYYVSNNGKQILSLLYDDVSTTYNARVETLLSSHLIKGIIRQVRQVGSVATDTNRMWLLRADGRLLSANVIREQEIMGVCEWQAADNGFCREVIVNGYNDAWICVDRNGKMRHEYMVENLLFQQSVTAVADLSGKIIGLPYEDGAEIWCEHNGGIDGPYSCHDGSIQIPPVSGSVVLGRWIAPVYESMPHVLIGDDDRIVRRPGRIHTANINIVDTTSIAVGANNEPVRDVSLLTSDDPVNEPMQPKSELIVIPALMGHAVDTTLVITQVRPGRLQIRDYSTGERL